MIKELSVKLKEKRQELGLSRKVVSEIIGISASTLADYENGYGEPSLKSLMKLASLYKCSTDFLLGIEKKPPQKTLDVTGLTEKQIKALEQLVEVMNTSPPDQ